MPLKYAKTEVDVAMTRKRHWGLACENSFGGATAVAGAHVAMEILCLWAWHRRVANG